ncbi:ferredoxin [Haloactinomyces albus]|uniref:Ferredoxin n=1 Tax=Haloactinomyces albus TaxID=1352928 RepID=A0AAE3ZFB4_9ACTN|nr:ferredoxin [Haloactinomyces albus]MDR7303857.1 hypothetical protein [Haloactinomyces albus]
MTVQTDDRLLDAPMEPVQCLRCDARLQVRKSSWQQTSIQWDEEAAATCAERRAEASTPGRCRLETCAALWDSIRSAAAEGGIHVPDDQY